MTSPRFKLGVIFHPTFPPETLRDFARRAEAAGFDELWLWDDCFLPGALTSAAVALSATERLTVGIGLLPATVYNPLFAAMEITTLARAFPGRIIPGFGHGVDSWMKQIGASPTSSMKTLETTVDAVRALLNGDRVTVDQHNVHLDAVQMTLFPTQPPPLYIGAMREKSMQLAGRAADGTILTDMSSPAYVRWTRQHIDAGIAERTQPLGDHQIAAYLTTKVSTDGTTARSIMRRLIASRLKWSHPQLAALGIQDEARALLETHGSEAAPYIPDPWVDALSAAGTPDQAAAAVLRLAEAGADSVILQPLDGDPDCLDEYTRYLLPALKR